ncbi:SusC/RagA family TonB-linked outer membrane protein [Chryseobacterium oryctis]|uniref:SusC/RagA family TonB-linked outer membrane protein n=1 Tax=Chryseobacterium oryctis TaxID=2952618 RepID=A0ABT3HQV1_9FLAO|nr:SusC/RagA family TonB-linked outer membrane protein [Chryseobacterium oryctis]MCW3162155.1 SusC/RagA family TonB-linked outer membrane protein [Chryseobacterium oryctis]
MNVKLRVLSAGVMFFIGGQTVMAQKKMKDTTSRETKIEEVVVLGYSKTATKAKSTEAATTISAETLENRPNTTFLNSLQGAAPGIAVNSSSGSPGSGKIDIMIRGISSLNASTDPLYVIDGLTTSATQFRNLNPNDIETLSILRDAQATSIYGNRGANGVVVITTKTGRFNSGLRLSYDMLTSFSTYPGTKYNMANAKEFLQIQNNYGAGYGATLSQEEIDNYATDTDWSKIFFRVGMSQQHNLGLRFGGENISVYSSLGYLNNEGIFNNTDFQRFTFRNNIVGKSKDGRFNYSALVGLGYSKRNQFDEEENSGIAANSIQNVLFGTLLSDPSLEPYPYSNGTAMYNDIGGASTGVRPWVLYDNMIGGVRNRYAETTINANVKASYKLTDYLSVGNRLGIEYKEYDRTFARSPFGYLSNAVSRPLNAYGGVETQSNIKDFTFNNVTNVTFDQQFGDHSITISAYLDYFKAHYMSKAFTQNGLDPLNWSFGAGTGYIPFSSSTPTLYNPSVSASKINAGTMAYFGTFDYDYKSRYGVGATIRRDGSYRFAKENRWETFWSVAGRWNIDKEGFMDGSKFKMLKLRASYGTQGNQNLGIPANNSNSIFLKANDFKDLVGSYTNSNPAYQSLPGYYTKIANTKLKWEKQSQANIGLDFNYNSFIEGSIDVYRKLTTRLFNDVNVSGAVGAITTTTSTLTPTFYISGNNGELENKGVEAALRFNILRNKDLKLSVFANTAYNKNKILSMENEDLSGDWVHAIGGPAGQWNLYRYVGVNHETGEQQFLDKNGNITEAPTADDRVLTGKSYYAKWHGGFGLDAEYKGFYATVFLSYQAGGWSYDNLESWIMDPYYAANGLNVSKELLNAWTPSNSNSDIPAIDAYNAGVEGSSDRFLRKTDFIKLKNVSVGYNFSKDLLRNLPIKSLKIFLQAENIYTWTDWKGYDPEPIKDYSLGIYPNPRTVSVGVNVEL